MLIDWLASFGSLYLEIAPLLIFGLSIAGLLHLLVPESLVERHLGGRGPLSVLKATLFAIPLPLCSCSVVPVVAGLRRKGASRGAAVGFLVAAPQIGADSFILTQGMLGLPFALYRAAASFVTALLAGASESLLPEPPATPKRPETDTARRRAWPIEFLNYAQELLGSMASSLLLGLVLAALILVLVPDGALDGLLAGRDWAGRLLMLLVGVPMYVCATASTPIAAALVMKGVSPGAALVFLLTGPATNIVTLAMLRDSLGLRPMLIYLASIASVALGAGWLLDRLPGLAATLQHAGHAHSVDETGVWALVASVLLGIMLLRHFGRPLWKRLKPAKPTGAVVREELAVYGMTCAHCAGRVVQAIEATGLAGDAEADPGANRVRFRALAPLDEAGRARLAQAIELAGFSLEP